MTLIVPDIWEESFLEASFWVFIDYGEAGVH